MVMLIALNTLPIIIAKGANTAVPNAIPPMIFLVLGDNSSNFFQQRI
jgi:hypothetical protein